MQMIRLGGDDGAGVLDEDHVLLHRGDLQSAGACSTLGTAPLQGLDQVAGTAVRGHADPEPLQGRIGGFGNFRQAAVGGADFDGIVFMTLMCCYLQASSSEAARRLSSAAASA